MEKMKDRLALWGMMNAEKWNELTEDKKREYVVNHANKKLSRLVKIDPKNDPDKEMARIYAVSSTYNLLDCHYNHQGLLVCRLEWSRQDGAKLLDMNII